MKRSKLALLPFALAGSLLVVAVEQLPAEDKAEPTAKVEEMARQVIADWLEILDSGDYAKSWRETATLLRGAVPQKKFEESVGAVLGPLGRPVYRELKGWKFVTTIPGSPDGEYVIVQYDSEFENKKSAVETVTAMKDADGQWRVAGDFIR